MHEPDAAGTRLGQGVRETLTSDPIRPRFDPPIRPGWGHWRPATPQDLREVHGPVLTGPDLTLRGARAVVSMLLLQISTAKVPRSVVSSRDKQIRR